MSLSSERVVVDARLRSQKSENSRLLREDLERGATAYRALPEVVVLNNTDICNLRCIMCQRSVSQGVHRLEDRVVRVVADELFPTAWKAMLTSAGGEPLGVGFDVILERALRHQVRLDVITNGILLDRERAQRLWPVLDHLNVSIDSSDPATYERIRVGARFEQVLAALEQVRAQRAQGGNEPLVSLSAVVMRSNLTQLPELVRFAAAHGLDAIWLQRLQHTVQATPEEDPARNRSAAEVEAALRAAEEAARTCGIALFASELGRVPVVPRPLRDKVPVSLEGRGLCVYLFQYFSVMYTGEVYPCCKPTDYNLGNVLYDDPVEIWNGPALQRLRRAHLSRRGTLFCSGCELAPHLRAGLAPEPLKSAGRLARRFVNHHVSAWVRKRRARREVPVHDGTPPFSVTRPYEEARPPRVRQRLLGHGHESVAVDPRTGEFVHAWNGRLIARDERTGSVRELATLPGGYVAALLFLTSGDALLSLESGGGLWRYEHEVGRCRPLQELSRPDSFVRSSSLIEHAGQIFVGEYGLLPGARVACLWRSRDEGRSFERLVRFHGARHVHCVHPFPDRRELLVTTGDLPKFRCAWRLPLDGGPARPWLRPMAGFTALTTTGAHLHMGTDLMQENRFVRWRRGSESWPEAVRLPAAVDLPVRRLVTLRDGSLLALLCSDDGNELAGRRKSALLHSADDGVSWSIVSTFEDHAGQGPEDLVLVTERSPGWARVLTARTPAAVEIEIELTQGPPVVEVAAAHPIH